MPGAQQVKITVRGNPDRPISELCAEALVSIDPPLSPIARETISQLSNACLSDIEFSSVDRAHQALVAISRIPPISGSWVQAFLDALDCSDLSSSGIDKAIKHASTKTPQVKKDSYFGFDFVKASFGSQDEAVTPPAPTSLALDRKTAGQHTGEALHDLMKALTQIESIEDRKAVVSACQNILPHRLAFQFGPTSRR